MPDATPRCTAPVQEVFIGRPGVHTRPCGYKLKDGVCPLHGARDER